jgi:hypothetical protein
VDVRRQYTNGLQLRGVYTWSKNLDDGSAWNTSVSSNTPAFVSYPGNPKVDYGLAATNLAHAAAINGTWELPFGTGHKVFANASALQNHFVAGWSLSVLASLQIGFPFSPQLGYNLTGNGDSRNPDRLQNTSIHARVRTQFRAEYFNILNHTNFTTPNPVVFSSGPTPSRPSAAAALSPTAGIITATATTSRQLQFALKFLF